MDQWLSIRQGLILVLLAIFVMTPHQFDQGWAQNRPNELEALKRQIDALNAQNREAEIELLKQQIDELRQREAERQRQIEALQRQIEGLQSAPAAAKPAESSPLDQAIQGLETAPLTPTQPAQPALLSGQLGGATFRLLDLSAVINAAVGGSTEGDEALSFLQLGGHDPRRNGFTLQATEVSLSGAVDPYFTAQVHLNFLDDDGETLAELEEAFITTQALPYGLEVEAGLMFTEFGIVNTQHSHEWDWLDQPVVVSRMFGPDNQRQVGARAGWIVPLPWFSQLHFGVQNSTGNTVPSFNGPFHMHGGGEGGHAHDGGEEEDEVVGQRPFESQPINGPEDMLWLVRWENAWALPHDVTAKLGASSLFGPNASGPDGRTIVAGVDLKATWRPERNFRGWPFLKWQSEFIWRHYEADESQAQDEDEEGHDHEAEEEGEIEALDSDTLIDWGVYSQLLYGFRYGWATGLRFEYADGSGPSVEGRSQDPLRDQRLRLSPMLAYWPTEFSRLRLQYNYDWADHIEDNNVHSIWLGLEVQFGPHPVHKY